MYLLIDASDDLLITSYNKEDLEEIALSLFEESVFEWFNHFINSKTWSGESQLSVIEKYARQVAEENYLIKVFQLPEPIDTKGSIS